MQLTFDESIGRYKGEIDGQTYEFEKWPARPSLRRLSSLAALIGEPMSLMGGARAGSIDPKQFGAAVLGQIGKLMQSNADSVIGLLESLTSSTGGVVCNGKPVNFDAHYAADFDLMLSVAQANLELQYGSLKKTLTRINAMLDSSGASLSPTISGTAAT